jgi:hypothetical protein
MKNGTKVYWHGQLQFIIRGDLSTAQGVVSMLIRDTKYQFSEYTFERVYNKEFA